MIFIILGVFLLALMVLTIGLAFALKALVPEFPIIVRFVIAFAIAFMILTTIWFELAHRVGA